ncbi:MAG TPA: hypothetical protein VLM05_15210 [Mycobacteriales bacterium]|nr:hypothetical protein [Mycobacteriales bacterium]
MANRWWVPAAAAAAVILIGAGSVLVLRRDGGGPAAAPDPAPAADPTPTLEQLRVRDGDTVTASGTVVVAPGKPARFCAPAPTAAIGQVGPEQPPDCTLGVDLVGADAARLTGVKTFRDTRWGEAGITGRYSGGTVTVAAQGAPVSVPGPVSSLPTGTPCPAPTGGWHPGPVDQAALNALTTFVQGHPDAYGEIVMTYPDGPPSGPTDAPGYGEETEVLMVTTVLPPADAERELRARFPGNLCVRPAVGSRAATDAVWKRVQFERDWRRHGAYTGGPDYLTGRVRVSLVVLDDAAYRWLSGAGAPIVDADPWLRPVR